mmetsp:Transcript_4014/g.6231  ORF Transcript_4014/g.6231 Transcript_4014/m.6231 type:complete len:289 (+) Transcript_4014:75-941(+)|eukprot:CAMPEP_0185023080 /NCGR_PEP_ID=MMETSP1103-20130426/5778_1 /TAXON_ID=36769 /ORGANISM="Paraphysomonas bandaiensis, Strain Caron Lab Isolate" /LENGTH=288 /DNA_ID=CAMNT_0027555501 /DNA_START=61 /DNA_END=927 /DNA_ORIENTATION=-
MAAVKRERVFDDPLTAMMSSPVSDECGGDDDECSQQESKTEQNSRGHSKDLVNSLASRPDNSEPFCSVRSASSGHRTERQQPTETKSTHSNSDSPEGKVVVPQNRNVAPPKQLPASVFESDDNIFLRKDDAVSMRAPENMEEELFGYGDGTSMKTMSKGNVRVGRDSDSETEDKFEDLGVGRIMEREELDFGMFGKSSVRQYEPTAEPSAPHPQIYMEDLSLQSEDVFAEMEDMLSSKETNTAPITSINDTQKSAAKETSPQLLDPSTMDINAYITQQESDNTVSLFD